MLLCGTLSAAIVSIKIEIRVNKSVKYVHTIPQHFIVSIGYGFLATTKIKPSIVFKYSELKNKSYRFLHLFISYYFN